MGGTPTYLIPAPYTGMSTFDAHTRRRPPSSEPGVDYYMPTGTPLRAPTRCRVVAVGGGIHPATGRFVTVDDGRRWLRFLHLKEWRCKVGDELEAGEIFGLSGASGYGSEFFGEPSRNAAFWRNTGGDHVHVTAFRGRGYWFGRDGRGSIDFHALTGGMVAGGNGFNPEEDDMFTDDDRNRLQQVYNATFKGGPSMSEGGNSIEASLAKLWNAVKPINRDGKQVALRQEVADTKTIVAGLEAGIQALAVAKGADPDAILKAVQDGVENAMRKVTFTADVDG